MTDIIAGIDALAEKATDTGEGSRLLSVSQYEFAKSLMSIWPEIRDRLRAAEVVCEYFEGTFVGHVGHMKLEAWRRTKDDDTRRRARGGEGGGT